MYTDSIHKSNAHSIQYLVSNMPMKSLEELVLHPSLPPIRGKHRDFAIRFRMAMQFSGIMGADPEKQRKFGSFEKAEKKSGMPYKRAFIGELYRGDKLPEQDKYETLAKVFGVDPVWLQTGAGDMVGGGDYNRLITALPPEIREAIDNILEPYRTE